MSKARLPKLETLPKIELHLHLDCSLSYDAVRQIDPDVTPDRYMREITGPAKVTDLAEYLARTQASVALLQTDEALRIAVQDLFHQLASENVIYAEIRFAPLLHTGRGLSPENVVRTVLDATNRTVLNTGIEARLILCTLRHFTELQGMATVRLVERFQDTRVAALDLAGDEAGYPLDAHIAAFEYAQQHNVPRIAHAGEAAGPESMREVIARLQPSRIGHGVRSIEDPRLVELLRRENIHLEICPACNVQVNVYEEYAQHPIDRLYRMGVPLSINTDARTTTPTTLSADYRKLRETFGWGLPEFLACNLQAVIASFAPPEVKRALASRLRQAYARA